MIDKRTILRPKGFTLIELLVVLGILGVLAVAVLAAINPIAQIQKSNDARRKSDLEQVQRALELYYQDTGKYPPASGDQISGANWGAAWQPYMSVLPKDPISTQHYVYSSPNNQTYYLFANLERGQYDPQVCKKGNKCTHVPNTTNCGTLNGAAAVCNYGVSSPNTSP